MKTPLEITRETLGADTLTDVILPAYHPNDEWRFTEQRDEIQAALVRHLEENELGA